MHFYILNAILYLVLYVNSNNVFYRMASLICINHNPRIICSFNSISCNS